MRSWDDTGCEPGSEPEQGGACEVEDADGLRALPLLVGWVWRLATGWHSRGGAQWGRQQLVGVQGARVDLVHVELPACMRLSVRLESSAGPAAGDVFEVSYGAGGLYRLAQLAAGTYTFSADTVTVTAIPAAAARTLRAYLGQGTGPNTLP